MREIHWIYCLNCGNKTRDRLREDTILMNYPLYCPKCKRETLINAKKLQIIVITEPGSLNPVSSVTYALRAPAINTPYNNAIFCQQKRQLFSLTSII